MSTFYKYIFLVFFVLTPVIFPAAQSDEDYPDQTMDSRISALSPLAREAFNKKVEELIAEKLENCKLRGLEDAARYVDSLIIEQAIMKSFQDADIPWKPEKPVLPDYKFESDSLKVAPLFDTIDR